MATLIQLRRGTSKEWIQENPVLALGEPGYETDTKILRIGDGISNFVDLTAVINTSIINTLSEELITKLEAEQISGLEAIQTALNRALDRIEDQVTIYPGFCINKGSVDDQGNANFIQKEGNNLIAKAPFTYTTASGITHTLDDDIIYDLSNLKNAVVGKTYNVFVNFSNETYSLVLLENNIYKQENIPENLNDNDIWLNKSVFPNISLIKKGNYLIQTDLTPAGIYTIENDTEDEEYEAEEPPSL